MRASIAASRSARGVLLGSLCVPLAIWGQWALHAERAILDGIVLFVVAGTLFLHQVVPGTSIAKQVSVGATQSAARAGRRPAVRRGWLGIAAASSALAFAFSGGNSFRAETVLFWMLAVAAYVLALWERGLAMQLPSVAQVEALARKMPRLSWSAVSLLLVLAVAAFFRYHQLWIVPAEMTSDLSGENPSVVRTGANTFVAALLSAVPVYLVGRRILEAAPTSGGRAIVAGAVIALLVATAQVNYSRYFVDYAVQYRQAARNSSEIAAVISGFASSVGSRERSYIVSWPHWVDTRNVALNMGAPDWNNVLMNADEIERHTPGEGNKLYIMHKADAEAARRLGRRFAEGQLRAQPSAVPGQEFLVFFVPGRE